MLDISVYSKYVLISSNVFLFLDHSEETYHEKIQVVTFAEMLIYEAWFSHFSKKHI